MAPRVPRRIAEMDREFDELASTLFNDPRDQLTSGIDFIHLLAFIMLELT